jgi:hypothetical protein
MKTTLLTIAVSSALLASAGFAQEAFFFRMESAGPTRIIEIDRNGLLTWSNAVTPTSFYLSGALSLTPTGAWHRVIYGETTNRTPAIQAPLANPLVCLGFSGQGTNMWIGRPFGASRVQIKNSGNRIRFVSVSRDEQHILYAEENVYGTDDCAIRLYDVPSDMTTTLLTHAGHNLAFDLQDQRYFFYIGSPPSTTIFRRALDGSTDTPRITDAGHVISGFVLSPDGNRIMIKSGDAGPPYLDRFVTFTSQGAFERLLLEASFDGYNFSFNPAGDQAVVSYRDVDCSGERHVIVYNCNTGAGQEMPTIATNWWPSSSCALYIAWAPYDDLLVSPNTGTNVFCSPVDGHVTGTVSLPSGYGLRGLDSDWRFYATDQSLTHILRLHKNP